jgi:hypothetical protein
VELIITSAPGKWDVDVVLDIEEPGDKNSRFRMVGHTTINKIECRTEQEALNTVQAAVSHMALKMTTQWRVPMMHRIRDTVMATVWPPERHGEASGSVSEEVPATDIAEGVVPDAPHDCAHLLIYCAPRATFGKCITCGTDGIDATKYGQSAALNVGFLSKLR